MLNLHAKMNLNGFKEDYQTSRNHFKETLNHIDQRLLHKEAQYRHPLSGPNDEALFCDVVFLGLHPQPQNVLVLISGTHGIEGFTGSAVQADCLPLLNKVLLAQPDFGVVIIHAMNPWGFAWLRRCDHEGIDLNRNFIDFDKPLPDNPQYKALSHVFSESQWLEKPRLNELWDGMDFNQFIGDVTSGQYQDPKGLYYGGKQASWSRQVLQQISHNSFITAAQRLSVIDVHTGLGPYGYGEVINDHLPHTAGFNWVNKLYGHNACSAHLGESCSAPKLGLLDFHWYDLMQDRGCFITLEFGTYATEGLISELIREQIYQNTLSPGLLRNLNSPYIANLKAFFYPFEASWQQQVLFRSRQIISLALSGMAE